MIHKTYIVLLLSIFFSVQAHKQFDMPQATEANKSHIAQDQTGSILCGLGKMAILPAFFYFTPHYFKKAVVAQPDGNFRINEVIGGYCVLLTGSVACFYYGCKQVFKAVKRS